jgi:plastocyanin
MNKVLLILLPAILVLSIMYMAVPDSGQSLLLQQQNSAHAQVSSQGNNNNATAASNTTTTTSNDLLSLVHPDIDSSPIVAVIVIGEDMQGNVAYIPNNVTIKVGEEILIVNNSTGSQSVTNGMGPDDPAAGTLFDTGPIPPRGFTEYVAANLSPGDYPFYSTNSTSTTGVLAIEPNG